MASTFDDAIAECLRVTAGARGARDEARWRRALKQAQLPVRMGGLGLTSAARQADASWCGSWALCWARLQRFFPELAGVDAAAGAAAADADAASAAAAAAAAAAGVPAPARLPPRPPPPPRAEITLPSPPSPPSAAPTRALRRSAT